jgi:hypothetical protein
VSGEGEAVTDGKVLVQEIPFTWTDLYTTDPRKSKGTKVLKALRRPQNELFTWQGFLWYIWHSCRYCLRSSQIDFCFKGHIIGWGPFARVLSTGSTQVRAKKLCCALPAVCDTIPDSQSFGQQSRALTRRKPGRGDAGSQRAHDIRRSGRGVTRAFCNSRLSIFETRWVCIVTGTRCTQARSGRGDFGSLRAVAVHR